MIICINAELFAMSVYDKEGRLDSKDSKDVEVDTTCAIGRRKEGTSSNATPGPVHN